MTLIYVLVAFAGLLSFLILHFALWQFLRRKNTVVLALTACAGYGVAAIGAHFLHNIAFLAHAPVSAPVFMFLAVTYFHFYFGIDRSVSVRTLGALACSAGRSQTLAELEAVYPKEEMVRRRLGILVEYGWFVERDGAFYCTDKGKKLARVARIGRKIYGQDATG